MLIAVIFNPSWQPFTFSDKDVHLSPDILRPENFRTDRQRGVICTPRLACIVAHLSSDKRR